MKGRKRDLWSLWSRKGLQVMAKRESRGFNALEVTLPTADFLGHGFSPSICLQSALMPLKYYNI